MGIYSKGSIFGLKMYNFNNDDISQTLFETKYDEIMSHQQMSEAYLFYHTLNNKNGIFFKIYTECNSTLDIHNKEIYMDWLPITLNQFLENFTPSAIEMLV